MQRLEERFFPGFRRNLYQVIKTVKLVKKAPENYEFLRSKRYFLTYEYRLMHVAHVPRTSKTRARFE